MGLQQVIQPGRPGSFFEDDAQISAKPVDELQKGTRLGLDDALHHDFAEGVPHRYRSTFRIMPHAALYGTCRLPDYADSRQVTALNFLRGVGFRALATNWIRHNPAVFLAWR